METRQSAKKQRTSAVQASRSSSPVSRRTRRVMAPICHPSPSSHRSASTPRTSRKKVRFSDPGLRFNPYACSTGLTPAMKRASVNTLSKIAEVSPSHKSRRRSVPAMPSRPFDLVAPFTPTSSERVIQFTPLRQILDQRTQRRIRRIGLSDEINNIEREKRDARSYVKNVETLRQERDTLQQELNEMKQQRSNLEHQSPSYSSFWTSSRPQSRDVEEESTWIQDDVSTGSINNSTELAMSAFDEGDTFILNENAVVVSRSPDFRNIQGFNATISDNIGLADETALDNGDDTEVQSISLDLEAASHAKNALFHACRSHMSALESYGMGEVLRQSSPPPDFFDNVINVLTTALSHASDATQALEGIHQECSTMGFSGENAKEIVGNVRSTFRSARLELERAIPSETDGADLDNGKATLSALVKRVKSLARDLRNERKFHYGSVGREKALRGQFDNLLLKYEIAAENIGKLEGSISNSASDMLHTRIKLQDLENEDLQKNIGIGRLSAALDKYHDDVKDLEDLIGKLEDKNLAMNEKHNQEMSAMEAKLNNEQSQRSAMEVSSAANLARIQELEAIVKENHIRAGDLTANMEALEKEHSRAVELLQQETNEQVQRHEQETGTLNVRISELTTTLETARSEAQRIRLMNASLEEQLQQEIDAHDEIVEKWAAEQARSFAYMKETVNSGRRSAKVRAANWELKSDDLMMSDGTTIMGSDPITPVNTARFIDIEYGRGKNRRRFDSGVGILSDNLLEDEGISDLPRMAENSL